MYWTENPKLQLQKNDLDEFVDINDQPIAFFGNPDLLPPKIKLNYTIEMIDELVKCRDDIIYFAENYYKAQTPNGFNFIKLHPYQSIVVKDMVENQHYVLMMPRQMGKCSHGETKLDIIQDGEQKETSFKDLFEECKVEFNEEK
jgi:hypothetical protein